jgi:hypothetical protein
MVKKTFENINFVVFKNYKIAFDISFNYYSTIQRNKEFNKYKKKRLFEL